MLGPVVTAWEECTRRPSICVLRACSFNIGPAQTPWGMGHRCGRLLSEASDEEQARAVGVSVEALHNIRSTGLAKMRRRLSLLEAA